MLENCAKCSYEIYVLCIHISYQRLVTLDSKDFSTSQFQLLSCDRLCYTWATFHSFLLISCFFIKMFLFKGIKIIKFLKKLLKLFFMSDLLFTFLSSSKTLGGLKAKRLVRKFRLHYPIERKILSLNLRA